MEISVEDRSRPLILSQQRQLADRRQKECCADNPTNVMRYLAGEAPSRPAKFRGGPSQEAVEPLPVSVFRLLLFVLDAFPCPVGQAGDRLSSSLLLRM